MVNVALAVDFVRFFFLRKCEAVGPSGKQKDFGSNPLRLSFFSRQKLSSVDTVLFVTLSLTVNETLNWLLSLPTLMQESFWW